MFTVATLTGNADHKTLHKLVHLSESGKFHLTPIGSLPEFIEHLSKNEFDVAIVGRHLSEMSNLFAIECIRKFSFSRIPILAVVDTNNESEIILALEAGADNCLAEYSSAAVIEAQIIAMGRRAHLRTKTAKRIKIDDYEFDSSKHSVSIGKSTINLQRKQFELALILFENIGIPISRARILEIIWKSEDNVHSASINSAASALRTKLGLYPYNGYILSITSVDCLLSRCDRFR